MASRAATKKPESPTESVTEAPAFSLTLTQSAGVPRASREGTAQTDAWYPTVLAGYTDSLTAKEPRSFPNLPSKVTAERIVKLLMAACKNTPGTSLRKAISGNDTTGYSVDFQASTDTQKRNYTVDDLRTWARENGVAEDQLVPKVHAEVRIAYRKAHGLYVKKDDK